MLVLKGEIDCWPPLWELKCSCINKNITVAFYHKKIYQIVWLNYTTAYTMICSWLSSLSSLSLLKLVYMPKIHKKVLCFFIFFLFSDVSRQNLMLEVNATVWYLNHNSAGQFQIPVKPSGPDSSSITFHPNLLISIAALLWIWLHLFQY